MADVDGACLTQLSPSPKPEKDSACVPATYELSFPAGYLQTCRHILPAAVDTYSLQAQAQTTFRIQSQSAVPYNCADARPVHSLWLYLCVFYMARAMDSALNQNLFAQRRISMLSADSPVVACH